ncbi:hypothetical protein DL98DRAFT_442597 [Cadophora sp. DSE1049]|nr:hypothetical protein DL98DRAFT_442597 [Cadophora sp. DSE1049]
MSGNCTNPSSHDEPLNHNLTSHQPIMSQWERICGRLATLIQPGTLSLYVVCDCDNPATAEMIIQPLLKLPVLQDCALRLSLSRSKELQLLAKNAVFKLTNRPASPQLPIFRFPDLPKEIQLNTMNFAWDTGAIHARGNHLDPGGSCRVRGMVAAESKRQPWDYLLKCFCERVHSSYNAHCDCTKRAFQRSYFLVSRDFRELAMSVFYGRNSITTLKNVEIPSLQRFPTDSIRFFTRLILNFERLNALDLEGSPNTWQKWQRTIDTLGRESNLAVLHLEIRFAERFYTCVWTRRDEDLEERFPGYEQRVLETYEKIIRPVTALTGLKSFFVHLNWGTSCGDQDGRFWKDGTFSIPYPDGREAHERKFERMVMGSEYDAWEQGKEIAYDLRYLCW